MLTSDCLLSLHMFGDDLQGELLHHLSIEGVEAGWPENNQSSVYLSSKEM